MRRSILAFAVAIALPASVAAQTIHVGQSNRVQSADKRTPSRGITATGSAIEKLPADDATITLRIMASAANAPTQTQLQELGDALVKAGFTATNVSKPEVVAMPAMGPSMSSLTATAQHPTPDLMKRAIAAVTAATSTSQFPFSFAQIQLRANNCTDALDRARVSAISRTRAKATTIAREIGVGLGPITALDDQGQSNADGSCTSEFGIGPGSAAFMPGQTSPDDYASVIVTSTVTITYAIK